MEKTSAEATKITNLQQTMPIAACLSAVATLVVTSQSIHDVYQFSNGTCGTPVLSAMTDLIFAPIFTAPFLLLLKDKNSDVLHRLAQSSLRVTLAVWAVMTIFAVSVR